MQHVWQGILVHTILQTPQQESTAAAKEFRDSNTPAAKAARTATI